MKSSRKSSKRKKFCIFKKVAIIILRLTGSHSHRKDKDRHRSKSKRHKRSKDSSSEREPSKKHVHYSHRDSDRKKRDKYHEEDERRSHKVYYRRHKSLSRERDNLTKSTTFIGEMLRNSKTKHLISCQEKTEILDSVSRCAKKQSKEEGEIPPEESFTPPLNTFTTPTEPSFTPPRKSPTQLFPPQEYIDNSWIPLPEGDPKPKKKSVLDLPMPPIVYKGKKRSLSNRSCSPETPELKPEHFKPKLRKTHYDEICQHLHVNPVVISPQDSFPEPLNLHVKARVRPTILNREPPMKEFPDRSLKTFKIEQKVGEGTYGQVFKARDLQTKNLVAMKFVRMEKESEGFPITGLREVKILRGLQHPNIIQLREIVQDDAKKKDGGTFLVFEYMNHDLMGLLDNESMVFDETTIYRIMRQILEGLNFCHKRNILHRDLKCSNILVNNRGEVKLADFGLGRQWICERPYTNKVISLWYRPVELLLGEEKYGTSVDLWSLGCILGELFQRRAVFQFGTELDMINAIFNLCGSPTKHSWPDVKLLPGFSTIKSKICRRTLRDTFNHVMPPLALDLFDKMLCLNPTKRITAQEALESNWITFMDQKKLLVPLTLPEERDCHELNAKLRRKKKSSSQPSL